MGTGGISQRAFRLVLAFSLALTLVASGILYAIRYKTETMRVSAQADAVRLNQTPALVSALWSADDEQVQALVNGMHYFPYIGYVAVRDSVGVTYAAGAANPRRGASSHALTYVHNGRELVIGTLELQIDVDRMDADLRVQILSSLALQAFLLVLESFFILLLFERLITRHLVGLSDYIRSAGADLSVPPLVLRKTERGDELDLVAASFNELRKRLEEARATESRMIVELKESEERYRFLVDRAPDAIMVFDADLGRFVDCNRRAESIFRRDRSWLLSCGLEEFYAPVQPDGLPVSASAGRNQETVLEGESLLVRRNVLLPDGRPLACEARLDPFPVKGRKLIRISYLDISERVLAEEAMATSLREKETLLQEIYHRTKNNMQVVAALLEMQGHLSDDRRLEEMLKETVGRIRSMALVHKKLYESRDLSRIDLGNYVSELLLQIKQAFLGGRSGIEIRLDAEEGLVSVLDTAVPCGLALNELVVNAVKYAFPGGRKGRILVSLHREGEAALRLVVSDDGIGLPAGFDARNDGKLGLQTVINLIELQLRGSVEFLSAGGTTCSAVLNDCIYEARI